MGKKGVEFLCKKISTGTFCGFCFSHVRHVSFYFVLFQDGNAHSSYFKYLNCSAYVRVDDMGHVFYHLRVDTFYRGVYFLFQ